MNNNRCYSLNKIDEYVKKSMYLRSVLIFSSCIR